MILLARLLWGIKLRKKILKTCYKLYILIKFGIKNDLFLYRNNDVIAAHLLRGYRGMHPQLHENIKKHGAIWCVLVYILIRFHLKVFPKLTILI